MEQVRKEENKNVKGKGHLPIGKEPEFVCHGQAYICASPVKYIKGDRRFLKYSQQFGSKSTQLTLQFCMHVERKKKPNRPRENMTGRRQR